MLKSFINIIITLCFILTMYSCKHVSEKPPVKAANTYALSYDLKKDLVLDTVKQFNSIDDLSLFGHVTFNEDIVSMVYAPVSGIVTEIKAELGDYVKKGEVIATIRSGDMAQYQSNLLSDKAAVLLAKKNMDVTLDLFEDGLASERDTASTKAALDAAQAELQRAEQVIKIFGSGDFFSVIAPNSGFVLQKRATPNMQIRQDNGVTLFTIGNLDDVWIIASVYEVDIDKIKVGDPVTVTTFSYPDKVFKGSVDKIFNVLDTASHTMSIRVVLDNKDLFLKPQMFAKINLKYTVTSSTPNMVIAPSNSVIFDNNKNFVVVYSKDDKPEIREVDVFQRDNDYTIIRSGVKPGERVLSKYQYTVYQEMSSKL